VGQGKICVNCERKLLHIEEKVKLFSDTCQQARKVLDKIPQKRRLPCTSNSKTSTLLKSITNNITTPEVEKKHHDLAFPSLSLIKIEKDIHFDTSLGVSPSTPISGRKCNPPASVNTPILVPSTPSSSEISTSPCTQSSIVDHTYCNVPDLLSQTGEIAKALESEISSSIIDHEQLESSKTKLRSRKYGFVSVLRSKEQATLLENLKSFQWEHIVKEFYLLFPQLCILLIKVMLPNGQANAHQIEMIFPKLGTIYGIIANSLHEELSLVQKKITSLLKDRLSDVKVKYHLKRIPNIINVLKGTLDTVPFAHVRFF
jgi:hypothetical protein